MVSEKYKRKEMSKEDIYSQLVKGRCPNKCESCGQRIVEGYIYKKAFDEGCAAARHTDELIANAKYESPFTTIFMKLPLVNTDVYLELRKAIYNILYCNWDYFREFVVDEYDSPIDESGENIENYDIDCVEHFCIEGGNIKIRILIDNYEHTRRHVVCDLRCFIDKNFLKEKMNEKL